MVHICTWCERVTDLHRIEVAWIDEINPEESIVENYCGERCLRRAIE
jgi:hypothetical protein